MRYTIYDTETWKMQAEQWKRYILNMTANDQALTCSTATINCKDAINDHSQELYYYRRPTARCIHRQMVKGGEGEGTNVIVPSPYIQEEIYIEL